MLQNSAKKLGIGWYSLRNLSINVKSTRAVIVDLYQKKSVGLSKIKPYLTEKKIVGPFRLQI